MWDFKFINLEIVYNLLNIFFTYEAVCQSI